MKKILWLAMVLSTAASTVRGQDIQYRGETSQGNMIQFVLTRQGKQLCVAQLQGTYTVACPLGQTQVFGYSIGTCLPLQKDGSFAFHLPLFPLSQSTFDISGSFPAAAAAEGSLAENYAALTFLKDPDCQVCQADETWTAHPVRSAGLAELNPDDFDLFLWVDEEGRSRIQLNRSPRPPQ